MRKLALAAALAGSLACSPVQAKTFVGVLWPMFGPLPAPGLVELVAELKMMPDVEVNTYVHQAWPSLVDDIEHQPPGTHTVVVGYSLGANSSVYVANHSKYIDVIVALQPSQLSWDPPVTGKVGRMIEIYNPNPWMTFGGMGSRKLEGPNIEYIANNDSHPGAQFNSQFRHLVKSEIAKFTDADRLEAAQVQTPTLVSLADDAPAAGQQIIDLPGYRLPAAQADASKPPIPAPPPQAAPASQPAQPEIGKAASAGAEAKPDASAEEGSQEERRNLTAFIEQLSASVNSGDLSSGRRLSVADLSDYAKRNYHLAHPSE